MRSLLFSFALVTPTKHKTKKTSSSCFLFPLIRNDLTINTSQDSQPQNTVLPLKITSKTQKLLRRREALVLAAGVSAGILSFGHLEAAAEEGPCEFAVAPSGLGFCDTKLGIGSQPSQGQLIKAHYVGKLEDGKIFDSSYNRGKPLTFRVGVGEVIKGWDQGILGSEGVPPMLPGGKRRLKIPPELGYGIRGAGCRGGSCIIPPNSVLLFDVEYIGKA